MEIEKVIDVVGLVGGLVASTGAATLAKEGAKIIIEKSDVLAQDEFGAKVCEWSVGVIAGSAASWAIGKKAENYKKYAKWFKEIIDKAKEEKKKAEAAKVAPVKVETEVVN